MVKSISPQAQPPKQQGVGAGAPGMPSCKLLSAVVRAAHPFYLHRRKSVQ